MRGRFAITVTMVLAAMAVMVPAPVAVGADTGTACRVRNVTQDVGGDSFPELVASARSGDRLTVRGTCRTDGAAIQTYLTVRGVGDDAQLVGPRGRWALRVTAAGGLRLRDLMVRSNAVLVYGDYDYWRGGTIRNAGWLRVTNVILRRGPFVSLSSVEMRDSSSPMIANQGWATLDRSSTRYLSNGGSLVMRDSEVRGGATSDSYAGGLDNLGTALLVRTRVVDNWSEAGAGGGIYNKGGLTLVDSIVARNENAGFSSGGGGIYNAGELILVGTVVRRNRAADEGGGIYNVGALVLSDSSVRLNRADGGGGGIANHGGTVSIRGTSMVGDNTPDDCTGTDAC